MSGITKIEDALAIVQALGLPRAQHNKRSALCLLALCNVTPQKTWQRAANPYIDTTPIMDWIREHYQKNYAPNTRETIRRQTMHQFVSAGIALYNPDEPERPVNSPKAVYQIAPEALKLIRLYGTAQWDDKLNAFLRKQATLAKRYANERKMRQVPVILPAGMEISLSPGAHSELIKAIIEEFAPRFAPENIPVYAGDTGDKWGYFDSGLLLKLGVNIDSHGKMPDAVLYYKEKDCCY